MPVELTKELSTKELSIEEKSTLACFLDLAEDYLKNGHAREKELPQAAGFENSADSSDSIEKVAANIRACQNCMLAETRTNTVPGEGASNPLVMVIGEGPGADEDVQGRPFVGKAGQLLDKMLEAVSLSREKNCFIANMVKCRPPGNRDPAPDEIASCHNFLERQILLLKPRLILCAGRIAAQNLLNTSGTLGELRGKIHEFKIDENTKIPVLVSYHPSAVLRDDLKKRPAWEDLKLLKSHLDFHAIPNEE